MLEVDIVDNDEPEAPAVLRSAQLPASQDLGSELTKIGTGLATMHLLDSQPRIHMYIRRQLRSLQERSDADEPRSRGQALQTYTGLLLTGTATTPDW